MYDVPGSDDRSYIEYMLETFYHNKRTHMVGPCAVLDICFTHPLYQKRGAGKLLVGWGVEEADRRGVGSWVEASTFGKGLYEKFGFGVGGQEGRDGEDGEVICEYWGLGPLGVKVGREAGVEVEGYGEGWKEEWTQMGYWGASWWFMRRKAKEA